MYFPIPTQIKVREQLDENTYVECGAIAYKDEIIFADNGQVVSLKEAPYLTIISKNPWKNISKEII